MTNLSGKRRSRSTYSRLTKVGRPEMPDMKNIPSGGYRIGISNDRIFELLETEDWALDWEDDGLFETESPEHTVQLAAFSLGTYPVTNEQYYIFIKTAGYQYPATWSEFIYPEGTEKHPVTGLNRKDALAYIDWLNTQLQTQFRLPTEAEWEVGARGTDERNYPWGDQFAVWRANTQENRRGSTTPVGTYSPSGDSPWELADMAGNVFEWTSSRFMPYPFNPTDGREDLNTRELVVVRGGAWYYSRKLARCSSRESVLPSYQSQSIGFRLAGPPVAE